MVVLVWLVVVACVGSAHGTSYVYDHLYNRINSVSFANTVPRSDRHTPLSLKVGLTIQRVLKLDADNQELVADAVLRMHWNDFRFAWHPLDMNGVNRIVWPHPEKIWTPDLVIDGIGTELDTSPEASVMRLDNSGNVTWSRRLRLRVPCDIPASISSRGVTCKISFISWGHDVQSLLLDPSPLDLSEYWTNSGYNIPDWAVGTKNKRFACCGHPFHLGLYNVTVVRSN